MYYSRIVGHATATVKHPSMEGSRLLWSWLCRPMDERPEGDPILAVDRLGAGHNETVLVTSDGIGTRELLSSKTSPVRWSVMGIPDKKS